MVIDDKYEVTFNYDLSNIEKGVVNMSIIVPRNLKNRGILDQLLANTVKEGLIDDFPLT
jgi:hypothetical protein